MKRVLWCSIAVVSFLWGQGEVAEVVEPEMPDWAQGELDELESGEYVPGSGLIGRLALEWLESGEDEVIELAEDLLELPEEEEPEELPTEIEDVFLKTYFDGLSQGFLNDPQKLLTTQEFQESDGLLRNHALNTEIGFYLYLFAEGQEIPDGESLAQLVLEQFDPRNPVAVVFYFLGAPERSELVFSEQVVRSVAANEREKVLGMSIEEAKEKSDPISQLKSFSTKLSEQLFWLEKVVAKAGGSLLWSEAVATLSGDHARSTDEDDLWKKLVENEGLFWGVVAGFILVLAGVLGWLGRWLATRRRTYVFPDAQGAPLFEAPYAAGVGGVLSFSSTTAPPSSQKSDVPDYLQKM